MATADLVKAEAAKIELARTLLSVSRRKILSLLMSTSLHISELARQADLDRSTAAYHLAALEKVGIVHSEYTILKAAASSGKAGRMYSVNQGRLKEAVRAMNEIGGAVLGESG